MTPTEIAALRRAGRLDEAEREAQAAFAQAQNRYTAGALFWCVNDRIKQTQDQSNIATHLERLKELAEYCDGDNYVASTIEHVEARLNPLAKEISEARNAAKNGRIDNDLILRLRDLAKADNLNRSLFPDYGWLIYHTIKSSRPDDVNGKKRLLADYLRLELPRPDLLHSMILGEALNLKRDKPLQFRFINFMDLWGLDNFRREDWEEYRSESNGHTFASLVEKMIGVYAKELRDNNIPAPEAFQQIVDQGLQRFPRSQNMPLYKVYVLISLGRREDALEFYKRLLLLSPSKFFLWAQASELVADLDQRIALLCKAISVERNEEFLGNCRIRLASALIEKGMMGNAKWELDRYRELYQSKCWHLKPEFEAMARLISPATEALNNAELYNQHIPLADEFIYSSIPATFAVKVADKQVDDPRHPGRRVIQWTLRTARGILSLRKPGKFGLNGRFHNGSTFNVRVHKKKIVWIRATDQIPREADWVRDIADDIRLRNDRNGRTYGLVDGVYVSPQLLSQSHVKERDQVKVLALKQEGGRWSAVSLSRQ